MLQLLPQKTQTSLFRKKIIQLITKQKTYGYEALYSVNDFRLHFFESEHFFSDLVVRHGHMRLSESEENLLETIQKYAGNVSFNINGYLRGQNTSLNDLLQDIYDKQIQTLDDILMKFTVPKNIICIRRVKSRFVEGHIKENRIYCDSGFLSTSLNPFYESDANSDFEAFANDTVFVIKVPKHFNGLYLEFPEISMRKEYELMLPRKTKLFMEKISKIGNNTAVVCQVIV